MEPFAIVPLDETDIPELLSRQSRAFESHAKLFDISVWTGETEQECRAELPFTRILVAKSEEGRILGGVRGREMEGVWLIRKLFVDQESRKRGVGRALMEAVERLVPSSCHKISVCTMLVLGENVRFFLDRGYIPDFLMPDHYNRLHLICFRKEPSLAGGEFARPLLSDQE
ncbi:MAG: GNAT family N-acetyltransferase [Nitrospiraceae bacterium]|nr:GNAT family N-acetyltransferase [Nitrospiraceae bacterium]